MFSIDATSKTPLHIQLYEGLKQNILTHYQMGDKLPSIRALASSHNLSKNTVQSAYTQLYAEGYIESRPKSGYYVSDFQYTPEKISDSPSKKLSTSDTTYRYDFFPARLTKGDFPLKLWKRLSKKALDEDLDFGAYHDGQGELGLRAAISSYLINSRGVSCQEDQIVICHGFSDAMGLLAKLLKNSHNTLAMEHPGYHVARRVFEEYNYEIEKIAVTHQGMDIDALVSSQAKLVYITPSHQYPTGALMPITNRLKLLAHMTKTGGFIIEDDYDSELRYHSRPIPALQGLDQHDCVVYMGTFAKSLSPALRVSYMVLPKRLIPLFKASYDAHFPRVSLITQHTLKHFIQEGHYEKHVRKIRTRNMKKHQMMKKILQEKLSDTFEILSEGGGLALLIMPTVSFDWERFNTLAKQNGIKLYYAKERSGGSFEALRMGFGGFDEEKLLEAIDAFAHIWHQAII